MDIRRVRNFIAVVEAGSIAQAATALHIAQPALSAQMRQLEETLGCELLVRSSRGVVPTVAGMELQRRGREALASFDALRAIGQDTAAEPAGHVTVGLPASVGTMLSVPLVEAVMKRFPGLELGLVESTSADLGDYLMQKRLDIAVLFEDNVVAGMQHEVLMEEDLFLVGSTHAKPEIPLALLDGMPLVMTARPNSMRMLLDRACARKGIAPRIVAEISSPYSMLQLASAGIGATVLPWSMVGGTRTAGLTASRIVSPALSRTLCLASNAGVPDAARVIAVRNLVRETLRRLVASSTWAGARLKKKK